MLQSLAGQCAVPPPDASAELSSGSGRVSRYMLGPYHGTDCPQHTPAGKLEQGYIMTVVIVYGYYGYYPNQHYGSKTAS